MHAQSTQPRPSTLAPGGPRPPSTPHTPFPGEWRPFLSRGPRSCTARQLLAVLLRDPAGPLCLSPPAPGLALPHCPFR